MAQEVCKRCKTQKNNSFKKVYWSWYWEFRRYKNEAEHWVEQFNMLRENIKIDKPSFETMVEFYEYGKFVLRQQHRLTVVMKNTLFQTMLVANSKDMLSYSNIDWVSVTLELKRFINLIGTCTISIFPSTRGQLNVYVNLQICN